MNQQPINQLSFLLKDTYSTQQLRSRLRALKNYFDEKFFGQNQTLNKEDQDWIKNLNSDFLNQFTKINTAEKLEDLQKEINNLAPLIVYIAYEIPKEHVEKIGVWLRENVNPKLIFEIKLDPNLIGGIALSKGGVYKDYSLRARIEANKVRLSQILNN